MSTSRSVCDVSRYRFQPQAGRNVDVDLAQTVDGRLAESDDLDLDFPGAPNQQYGLGPNEVPARASTSVDGLDQLIEQHDRVMLIRAEAAVLLQRRGEDISTLAGQQ